MKLSIIIVTWNVKADLAACLSSLKKNAPLPDYETIVVDNNSSDGTAEYIKQHFPQVKVIENRENKGFAKANNQGIRASKGEYIFLLNPDTIVHPGSLDILVDFMDDNPDAGACGGKLLNADGSVQRSVRRFPTFRAVLYCHTVFRLLRIFRGSYKKWRMKEFGYDRQIPVDQLMGAALLLRISAIDTGETLDESFFMYFEEVDLCYRIKQAGWRIEFVPNSNITHLGGQSSKQVPLKRIMLFKSMLRYFRKHRGKFEIALFSIVFKIALILRNFLHLVINMITYLWAFCSRNKSRMIKASDRIILHALYLTRYLWQIIRL